MSHRPRIVVGLDGSPSSRAALRWALDHARVLNARVDAILAWNYPHRLALSPHPMMVANDVEQQAHHRLATILDDEGVGPSAPGGPQVAATAVQGAAPGVLLAEAEGADLLVLGAHGRAVPGTVLGSVSLHCAAHAPCALVIVPAPPAHARN
jgi:nucleotide-binding universal stress UspA family protein